MTRHRYLRPRAHARLLALLLPAFLAVVPAARAADAVTHATPSVSTPSSAASGTWANTATWRDGAGAAASGAPDATSTVVVGGTDTVTLDADAEARNVTVAAGGTLDLNGSKLTVYGDVTLADNAALSSSSASTLEVHGTLTINSANVVNTAITVDLCADPTKCVSGKTPAVVLNPGSASWSSSSLTQTGGAATLAGHDNGVAGPIAFSGVAVAVTAPTRLGAVTFSGTGSLGFTATTSMTAFDEAILKLDSAAVSGTQTVATTWTYDFGLPYTGDRVNLVSATSGDLTPLSTADEGSSQYTKTGTLVYGTYRFSLLNTGAPTLASGNAAGSGLAKPGDTLTCGDGSWNASPDSLVWSWKRGSADLSTPDTKTYVVTTADLGDSLRCQVTASASGSNATSGPSGAVSVPAAPAVTVGTPTKDGAAMGAAIDRPGTWALPWAVTGGTVTGCKLNGAATACSGTSLAFDPASVTNGSTVSFEVTVQNAAGLTATGTTSFRVQLPVTTPPSLNVGRVAVVLPPNRRVEVPISTDATSIACTLNGAPLACSTTLAVFTTSIPATFDPVEDVLTVVATGPGGTTTETRTFPIGLADVVGDLPPRLTVEAGTTVTFATRLDVGFWQHSQNPYNWRGDLADRLSLSPNGDAFSGWITVRADKPGTYRPQLYWGSMRVDEMLVEVVRKGSLAERALGGITDLSKPLSCPGTAPFQWYVNGRLAVTGDSPHLDRSIYPKAGTVHCVSTDPKTGKPVEAKALIFDGARMTATADKAAFRLVLSTGMEALFEFLTINKEALAAKKQRKSKSSGTIASFKVKAKRGASTIKVPASVRRKLGKRTRYTVRVRLVSKRGTKSPPLTLSTRGTTTPAKTKTPAKTRR